MIRLACAALLVFSSSVVSVSAYGHTAKAPSSRPAVGAAVASGSWTVYHHDNAHTGYDPTAPAMSAVQTTPGWGLVTLDDAVYAEVLVYNGLVYAATLNNTVYALDQATGQVVWSNHVGDPQTGGWTCGNISPTGILGTPVIDTASNRIYAVAEITGGTPTYHLFGLDLNTGATVFDTPITPAGFDWKIQQERGALALANGFVYVPFGGRAGDCFDSGYGYRGWVVGVPTGGGNQNVFVTPGTGEGIWGAGGVVVDDSTGNVFFSTGNGIPCTAGTYSDAVIRVNPNITALQYFEPNDWDPSWCSPDSDLGSAGPLLISPNLLFQAGKHGGGFLIDPTNLGGVDGQLYPAKSPYVQADVCQGKTSDATFGSFAYAAPFLYVECEGGLVALNVNTAAPSFTPCGGGCGAPDWVAGGGVTFGPPIVAGGAVWVASNNNGLYAFNATTGVQIFHSAGFAVHRFVTPTEAGGQVFVPSDTVIRSFSYGLAFAPKNLNFGGQVPGTTSAPQTVTLHNIQSTTLNVASAALGDTVNYVKGTDTCSGMTVAAGGSCSVQVSFKPGVFGAHPTNLTFTDNGLGSPQAVPIYGAGVIDNQGHLYTLDGYGGLHAAGTAPALPSPTYWGWNIARSLDLFPDGMGGYIMDGYGGLHPFGNAPAVVGFAYWGGWDIARQVVLAPWSNSSAAAGWTLDGLGGIHEFGGAPAVGGNSRWGWDIARGLVILPDSTPSGVAGYTLDGYGGVHPFGGAPAVTGSAYWGGWDIARGITLMPTATRTNPAGWVLDGYGGVHPFGGGQVISNNTYWGWDIGRSIVSWSGSGSGGWVMDGFGGIHAFGTAPAISGFSYWPGWDIAVALGGPAFGGSQRRRT